MQYVGQRNIKYLISMELHVTPQLSVRPEIALARNHPPSVISWPLIFICECIHVRNGSGTAM
jgi:hypothetical protein